jgi:hypothetical protein
MQRGGKVKREGCLEHHAITRTLRMVEAGIERSSAQLVWLARGVLRARK